MKEASTSPTMSPQLHKVAERARREPQARFHSLAHLIDPASLRRAFHRQRPGAAVGVDGVSKADYEQDLEVRLRALHERLRSGRHQPIRRVHLPKEGRKGQTRPIGISCFEDKLVQDALREVIEAVYEPVFRDCSYGFRPGRSPHDAIRRLNELLYRGEVSWVLEADVASFFDTLDRAQLQEMLGARIPDGSLRRLVGKCKRGASGGGAVSHPGPRDRPRLGVVALAGQYLPAPRARHVVRGSDTAAAARSRLPDPVCRRLRHRLRASRGCPAGDGGIGTTAAAFWPELAGGQDAVDSLPATAPIPAAGEGAGHVRLSRLHLVLAAEPEGRVGADVQDAARRADSGRDEPCTSGVGAIDINR